MIDVITRINVSDFDLNLVTASISPSIQDVRELHALSPPLAARYALGVIQFYHKHTRSCNNFYSIAAWKN